MVVRTFSKIHGLAGFRVGYAVMSESLADYVHRVRAPFNVGSVAQAAATAALADEAHVERSRRLNLQQKAFLREGLEALGLEVAPSQANFLFVDVRRSASDVYQALLERSVIVRALPPVPSCLRITVGTRSENERCLSALEAVLT